MDKITKVAHFFNVTTDYLLGLSEDSTPPKIDDIDIITLQRAKQNMSQKDQEKMMAMLKIAFDYAFQDDNKGVD